MRWVLILYLFLFSSCSYRSTMSDKELKRGERRFIEIQEWYNNLVKRSKNPIYVFETDTLNLNMHPKGNLLEYILIDLDYNLFNKDGLSIYSFEDSLIINRYHKYAQPIINAFNLDSVSTLLAETKIKRDDIYFLIPLLTDSSSSKADSINSSTKFSYTYNLERRRLNFSSDALMGITELVKSNKYTENFSKDDIPSAIKDSLNSRLKYLIGLLPDNHRKKVENTELVIMDPSVNFEPSDLWLKSSETRIIMSSRLLRASIIDYLNIFGTHVIDLTDNGSGTVENLFLLKYKGLSAKPVKKSNSRVSAFSRTIEANMVLNGLCDALYNAYDFLLLHELAHIYLNDPFDEVRCDCYALNILKTIKPEISTLDLGVFNRYLVTPNVSESSFWFGTSNPEIYKHLKIRQNVLETMIQNGSMKCQ